MQENMKRSSVQIWDKIFCYSHHVFQVFFLGLNKTISSNLDIFYFISSLTRLALIIVCTCQFGALFSSYSSLLYHKYSRIVVIWHEEFYTNKLNFNRKKNN